MMFGKQLSDQIQLGIDLANIIIFVITLCALILTLLQLRRDIKINREVAARESARSREAAQREREMDREIEQREKKINRDKSARELYRDYLKVALNNPSLSMAEYNEHDPLSVDKYDTFVSIMLFGFDEMLSLYEDIRAWHLIISYHIHVHQKYIRATFHKSLPASASFRSAYSDNLLNIIDETLEVIDREAPDAAAQS